MELTKKELESFLLMDDPIDAINRKYYPSKSLRSKRQQTKNMIKTHKVYNSSNEVSNKYSEHKYKLKNPYKTKKESPHTYIIRLLDSISLDSTPNEYLREFLAWLSDNKKDFNENYKFILYRVKKYDKYQNNKNIETLLKKIELIHLAIEIGQDIRFRNLPKPRDETILSVHSSKLYDNLPPISSFPNPANPYRSRKSKGGKKNKKLRRTKKKLSFL
jgi:hypothetical protein